MGNKDYIYYYDDEIGVVFDNSLKKLYKTSSCLAKRLSQGMDEMPNLNDKNCDFSTVSNVKRQVQLIMTTNCNLRCRYCYAHGGNYGLEKINISYEILDKCIDYIVENKISKIIFFGGEPFLNSKGIEYVIERTKDIKDIKYAAVTNLTVMNANILRMIKTYNISLTVSLDGPQEINDLNRYYENGIGVYQDVAKNIEYVTKNGVKIRKIECTYGCNHKAKNISKESLIKFFNRSFPGIPVEICNEKDIEKTNYVQYEKLSDADYVKGWFLPRHNTFCSAGSCSITICPNGDIYPCQLFVNQEKYKLGNICKGLFRADEVLAEFENIKKTFGCENCTARNICTKCMGDIVDEGIDMAQRYCKHIIEDNERAVINFVKKRDTIRKKENI